MNRRPGGESAWVCTDINIYFEEGDPRVVVAPDVAVAFGVDVGAVENRSTYKVWEAGAAPGCRGAGDAAGSEGYLRGRAPLQTHTPTNSQG